MCKIVLLANGFVWKCASHLENGDPHICFCFKNTANINTLTQTALQRGPGPGPDTIRPPFPEASGSFSEAWSAKLRLRIACASPKSWKHSGNNSCNLLISKLQIDLQVNRLVIPSVYHRQRVRCVHGSASNRKKRGGV